MSVEGRQSGKNVWDSLGYEYAPGLTGMGQDKYGFGYQSQQWKAVGQINRQNTRALDDMHRSYQPVFKGDTALIESLNQMNKFKVAEAKNAASIAIRNMYESEAFQLASKAAMTPDDVKQTIKGPDTAYQLGGMGMQVGGLMMGVGMMGMSYRR